MKAHSSLLAFAIVASWSAATLAQASKHHTTATPMPTIAGWVETVTFPDHAITLDAKLDTGALMSSLSVTDLERFKRAGKIWYRFTLHGAYGTTATIEQRTRRVARVTRAEVKDTRRPIVRLKVCVAGHEAVTDFTLTDRSGQDYQVLIGRKFLATRMLVDSGHTHLFATPCEGEK